MARTAPGSSRTYLPNEQKEAQIIDFVDALKRRGAMTPQPEAAIIDIGGHRTQIPDELVDVLRQVADSLRNGCAVTVAPLNTRLTTQEAADFLGISRPTLVRILERGELRMERPGRHRYVRLNDLLEYQRNMAQQRSSALRSLAHDAEELDLYAETDGTPPAVR